MSSALQERQQLLSTHIILVIPLPHHSGEVITPTDGLLRGDANANGQVTGADLISMPKNYGNALEPVGTAVPEPASVCLLTLMGLSVLARRR